MKETKNKFIKGRCTPTERKKIDDYVHEHDIDISTLILSSVMAYIQTTENASVASSPFSEQVKYNIFRNRLLNKINTTPAIPAKTKERICKEMMEL